MTAILVVFAVFELKLAYLHVLLLFFPNSWKTPILQICGFYTTRVSQKGSKTEWGGDITIHTGGKKRLASGCVSSCRQVDVESNKDTNNCQGVERDKARDGGGGGRKGRSEQERDQETEGDRECFSSEQNVVIYLVAAKQIRRLPVLWLSQWGAVRFRRISPLSMQQTLNTPAVLSLLSQHVRQTFSKCFLRFVCFNVPQCPSQCSSSIPLTFFLHVLKENTKNGKWWMTESPQCQSPLKSAFLNVSFL